MVEEALEEGSNSLFLNTSNININVPVCVEYAVETAKCSGLKIFLVIDPVPVKTELSLPGLKKALKEDVKNNVSKYNIDGLCFDLKDVDNRIALNSEMLVTFLKMQLLRQCLLNHTFYLQLSIMMDQYHLTKMKRSILARQQD